MWSIRRIRRNYTVIECSCEILPVNALSVKRARPPVNHNCVCVIRYNNLPLEGQSSLHAVDYNIWLLSINYDSARRSVSRFSRLRRSISTRCIVAIIPAYGIINYKSVTTIVSRNVLDLFLRRFSREIGQQSLRN